MALQKTVVPFTMGLSLNTKADPFQVTGALLKLENGFVQSGMQGPGGAVQGKIQKRNGYNQLSQNVFGTVGATPIQNGVGLTTFNNELVLLSTDHLYSYAPGVQQWADKGVTIFTEVETTAVESNSYQQTAGDMAITNNTAIFAWEDSRGGCYSLVRDLESGAILVTETQLSANGTRPRCFAIGVYLFVFFYDTSLHELLAVRVDTTNPSAISSAVVVASDINTSTPYFDVCAMTSSLMIVVYHTAGNEMKVLYYLQSNAPGGVLNGVPAPITINVNPNGCITCFPGQVQSGLNTAHIAWYNTSAGVEHLIIFQDFTTFQPTAVIDSDTSLTVRNITGVSYVDPDGYGDGYGQLAVADLFWEKIPADTSVLDYFIKTATYNYEYNTADASTVFQRSAGIASKAYRSDPNNLTSLLCSFQTVSALQDTYFAVNTSGQVEAKVLPQVAGGHTSKQSNVPNTWLSNGVNYIAVGQKTKILVGSNTSYTTTGVTMASINYNSPNVGPSGQLGQNLHIPGGYVRSYDGLAPVEHNFHIYPEQPSITQQVSGALSGTYEYILVYEWQDANGQVHQSTTSVPLQYKTNDGYGGVILTMPTLRYTDKKAPLRAPLTIAAYRTQNLGSIFYKVTSDSSPVYNDTTVDTVTFTDTLSDTAIASRPELYITGGVLDNAPAPACTVLQVAQNRIFVGGIAGNTNGIAFSKPWLPGQGVAFSPEQVITISQIGGDITALAEMDQNVIVFKQSAIYILSGNGPDVTGNNGAYQVQRIATDVGCTNPSSIVLMPQGLMFMSSKGIWLFDRSLNTSYIGADVEAYNSFTVTGAQVVPDLNQVRFTTLQGTTLVYNYYFNIWSTFTNQASVAATVWQDTYVFARAQGTVWQEDRTSYSDNGRPIITKIGTSWFSLAGIQGYQHFYRGQILGTFQGDHNLKVSVFYDFNEGDSEEFTYNLKNAGYGTTWGQSATYGSNTYYGGNQPGNYQFYFQPKTGRCEAMRLEIEDYFPTSIGSAGFQLSEISFQIGLKKGMMRLPAAQGMTSTS